MTGVIGHIVNPTSTEAGDLAVAAESCGAEWIGFADAFWWRDVWMLLVEVARRTNRIRIGPAMTNPYMRHRFHTASALATLEALAGPRTLLGVAAGGSELTVAAKINRADAAERAAELVESVRGVATGEPLDSESGRSLDLALTMPRVLIAGRGDAMLRTAGQQADDVLLWAIPDSDLERSVGVVMSAAATRGRSPRLIWAPLVRHGFAEDSSLMHVAVYAALNTRRDIRLGWGLDDSLVDEIRSALVSGGTARASSLVPDAALDDLVATSDTNRAADRARALGVKAIATPGFSLASLDAHINWAADVETKI